MAVKILNTPLDLGKEVRVVQNSPTAAGSEIYQLSLDAEAVLVSLYVSATSGDVDVNVTTEGAEGQDVEVITFPTISAPVTELLLRKSASVLRKIRINVTYTGSCSFEIRARGVSAAASSVVIEGASDFSVTQKDITTTATTLLAASLTDRRGILVKNNNIGSAEVLYIANTLAKATSAVGFPIEVGGNLSLDLQAGSELYAISSSGTIDVRIVEAGGN